MFKVLDFQYVAFTHGTSVPLCILGNFSWSCCGLQSFSRFFNKILNSNTVKVSNGLNPDQDGRSVCPILGPNCL